MDWMIGMALPLWLYSGVSEPAGLSAGAAERVVTPNPLLPVSGGIGTPRPTRDAHRKRARPARRMSPARRSSTRQGVPCRSSTLVESGRRCAIPRELHDDGFAVRQKRVWRDDALGWYPKGRELEVVSTLAR